MKQKKRILIYGAGVIGSLFAGKLANRGNEITILARDKRYNEIASNGILLKNIYKKRIESYSISTIKTLEPDDLYDYIIVAVQTGQIDAILPILKANRSKAIVFVVNNPLGYDKYIKAVGKERVMIGFPSAGGERKEGVVHYFIGNGFARLIQTTTFGELDGKKSERLNTLIKLFRKAGFASVASKRMELWQRTHVAFVLPIAKALYCFDSNHHQLADSPKTIRRMILAIREGLDAIEKEGIRIEPSKLNLYRAPIGIPLFLYQLILKTKIAEYTMAKHTINAKKELDLLEEQFLSLYPDHPFIHWKLLSPQFSRKET